MQTLAMLLAGILLYFMQPQESHPPNVATHDEQIVLLISFLANILLQLFRDARQRKWQIEDTARQKAALQEHEQSVKAQLASQTQELKQAMRTRVTDLSKRFDGLLEEEIRRRTENDR